MPVFLTGPSFVALTQLKEIDRDLESFEKQVKRGSFSASDIRDHISVIDPIMKNLTPFVERLCQASSKPSEIQNMIRCYSRVQDRLSFFRDAVFDPEAVTTHGGISNGGNTCFLASALQVMAVIPQLRALWTLEEEEEFLELKRLGNTILDKITQGQRASGDEIEAFRAECLAAGIVDTMDGQEDAQEVLSKLVGKLGASLQISWDRKIALRGEATSEVPFGMDQDPFQMSSVEELSTWNRGVTNLELAPFVNLNNEDLVALQAMRGRIMNGGTIEMQTMINRFWEAEEGDANVRNYNETTQTFTKISCPVIMMKRPCISEFPHVIQVGVKQLCNLKVTPTQVDFIYPAGVDEQGVGIGPRYRLMAVIEHRPGHYVMRGLIPDGRVVEANDSSVKDVKTFERCPGSAYFYVKEDC